MESKLDKTISILGKSSIVLFEWTVEPDISIHFVSDSISVFGYTPEDFYEGEFKNYWQFVYEPDRERAKKMVLDARARQQKELRHNYRVTCKNGRIKWVEELVIFEKDHFGEVYKELGILYDVTKQKQMEEVISRSEKKYRNLLEKGPTIVIQVDPFGKIITVNKAALNILEYRKHELLGMPIAQLSIDPLEDQLMSLFKESSNMPIEINIKNKSDRIITLSVLIHRLESDELTNELYLIGQNITQKKAHEDQIQYISYHDKLTGLYNGHYLHAYLLQLDDETERHYAIIMGELNRLSETRDLFGHKLGDDLILAVSDIIKRCCRQTDIVCRVEDDQFVMILPDADDHVAKTVCERIKEYCESQTDLLIVPQISLGFSSKQGKESSVESVLEDAKGNKELNKFQTLEVLRSDRLISLKDNLENKTLETTEHLCRVQQYCIAMARKLGLPDALMDTITMASFFHDVGRIGIPSDILTKKGALTDCEWSNMKRHCEFGYNAILACGNLEDVAIAILHHHEQWDGTGYPNALKESEIPLISRIIAIADAYDAMTNDRVYSRSMSRFEAIEEMQRCKGTQFDPQLVDLFMTCMAF